MKADDKEDMIRRDAGIYLHWGRTVYCKDTRDPLLLAQAQQEALERLQENLETLKTQTAEILPPKPTLKDMMKNIFKRKEKETL